MKAGHPAATFALEVTLEWNLYTVEHRTERVWALTPWLLLSPGLPPSRLLIYERESSTLFKILLL